MPYISIEIGQLTSEQKKQLIERLTATASEITHIPEQSFTVIIKEYDSDYSIDYAIEDNVNVLKQCQVYNLPYVLIDTEYDVDISLP
ncbi:MAG: tautomerase family protein [Muribaculaceae bacterium]|jgi:4-oxalocrotonate tautomerase family enzyme